MTRSPASCVVSVLVCGGRDYQERATVAQILDTLHRDRGVRHIITGGGSGADFLGEEWAEHNGVPATSYPADWGRYGRAAGPIRNGMMLRVARPDLVVAFPGGPGTADMVRQARKAGVEVHEVSAKAAEGKWNAAQYG